MQGVTTRDNTGRPSRYRRLGAHGIRYRFRVRALNRPWRGVDVHFLDPDAAPEDMDDRNAAKKFKEFSLEAKKGFRDAGLPLVDGKAIKVTTFLNRLLGLSLKLQTQVLSYWHIIMQELIRDPKSTGKFQEGILDIGSELVLEKESVLFQDPGEGTRTCLNRLVGDRGVSWEQAKKLMEDQEDRSSGIYRKRARRDRTDVYNIFLALEKKQMVKNRSQRTFVTVEPHSGFRPDEVSQRELRKDFEMLSNEDAEDKWKAVYELSKDKCACKVCDDPATCELKKRTRAYHVLTGSVLPFWSTIKSYMQAQEEHLDAEEEGRGRPSEEGHDVGSCHADRGRLAAQPAAGARTARDKASRSTFSAHRAPGDKRMEGLLANVFEPS